MSDAIVYNTDIAVFKGGYFNYEDMSRNTGFTIEAVAKGLSNECRFAGQCDEFYSVAQHSLLVAKILKRHGLSRQVQFAGLVHDMSECVMKDIPTPLKKLIPQYYVIEKRVQDWMVSIFAPEAQFEDNIRVADLIALGIEQRDVMHNTDPWLSLKDISKQSIAELHLEEPMYPFTAYHAWLGQYHVLRDAAMREIL